MQQAMQVGPVDGGAGPHRSAQPSGAQGGVASAPPWRALLHLQLVWRAATACSGSQPPGLQTANGVGLVARPRPFQKNAAALVQAPPNRRATQRSAAASPPMPPLAINTCLFMPGLCPHPVSTRAQKCGDGWRQCSSLEHLHRHRPPNRNPGTARYYGRKAQLPAVSPFGHHCPGPGFAPAPTWCARWPHRSGSVSTSRTKPWSILTWSMAGASGTPGSEYPVPKSSSASPRLRAELQHARDGVFDVAQQHLSVSSSFGRLRLAPVSRRCRTWAASQVG